jgi:hypothetical protein
VVVSAAAGAVRSVVSPIARIKGCRAVGVVGSDAKCHDVVEELGLDACLKYKTQDLDRTLAEACPSGVDVYYDNVVGAVLAAVLRHINRGAHPAGRPDLAVQRCSSGEGHPRHFVSVEENFGQWATAHWSRTGDD